jgi:hypothetical protein
LFLGHYFGSIQRKKGYVSGLIIGPRGAKIARFLGFIFRHAMAEYQRQYG